MCPSQPRRGAHPTCSASCSCSPLSGNVNGASTRRITSQVRVTNAGSDARRGTHRWGAPRGAGAGHLIGARRDSAPGVLATQSSGINTSQAAIAFGDGSRGRGMRRSGGRTRWLLLSFHGDLGLFGHRSTRSRVPASGRVLGCGLLGGALGRGGGGCTGGTACGSWSQTARLVRSTHAAWAHNTSIGRVR